jgi:hypothetical protein
VAAQASRPRCAGLRGGNGPRQAGCKEDLGRNEEKGREGIEILFSIFKRAHKIEYKHKFESKQIKTMQQHVCNNKLL